MYPEQLDPAKAVDGLAAVIDGADGGAEIIAREWASDLLAEYKKDGNDFRARRLRNAAAAFAAGKLLSAVDWPTFDSDEQRHAFRTQFQHRGQPGNEQAGGVFWSHSFTDLANNPNAFSKEMVVGYFMQCFSVLDMLLDPATRLSDLTAVQARALKKVFSTVKGYAFVVLGSSLLLDRWKTLPVPPVTSATLPTPTVVFNEVYGLMWEVHPFNRRLFYQVPLKVLLNEKAPYGAASLTSCATDMFGHLFDHLTDWGVLADDEYQQMKLWFLHYETDLKAALLTLTGDDATATELLKELTGLDLSFIDGGDDEEE